MKAYRIPLQLRALVFLSAIGVARPCVGAELSAYQYVVVVPPEYDNGQADAYGLAAYLQDRLALVGLGAPPASMESIEEDPALLSRTLWCYLQHSYAMQLTNYADIRLVDALGNVVYQSRRSAMSWGTTPDSDVRKAINGICSDISKQRPAFNAVAVVDIRSLAPEVPRLEVNEESLRGIWRRASKDGLEGVWVTDDGRYRLATIRDTTRATRAYLGVVLSSRMALWSPGMVKFVAEASNEGRMYSVDLWDARRVRVHVNGERSGDELTLSMPEANGSGVVVKLRQVLRPEGAAASREADEGGTAYGTGWMCAPSLVATSYHVVKGRTKVTIGFPPDTTQYRLMLVRGDAANDVAVLSISMSAAARAKHPPLPMRASRSVAPGEAVYAIGFPLGELLGSGHKVTVGVVSATSGVDDDPRMLQMTTPIQPGNSGGPLFDAGGAVVGIVTASLRDELVYSETAHLPQNVNFAMKIDYLGLLDEATAKLIANGVVPNQLTSVPEKAQRGMASVGRVMAGE